MSTPEGKDEAYLNGVADGSVTPTTPFTEMFDGSVPTKWWSPIYFQWVTHKMGCHGSDSAVPYSLTLPNGNEIFFFLTRKLTQASKELVRSKCGWGKDYPCNFCRDRILFYLTIFGESGCAFDATIFGLPEDALEYEPGYTGAIFPTSQFYHSLFKGKNNDGKFPHVTLEVAKWNDSAVVPSWWDALLHKYFPLVFNLFKKHGDPGIQDSLALLTPLLKRVPYGDKLNYATSWLKKHLPDDFNTLNELNQTLRVISAILSGNGVENRISPNDPTMTCYHQAKDNVIDVLACAESKNAVVAILKDRFSPENYCRSTTEASAGQIAIAMKLLGDFIVEVMTRKTAVELYGAISFVPDVTHPAQSSSMSAFDAILQKKKSKGAAGFSSRVKASIAPPTTLSELLTLARSSSVRLELFVENRVEVNEETGEKKIIRSNPAIAFTTDLGDKVIHPHLWCYENRRDPNYYGLAAWISVSAILPMQKLAIEVEEGEEESKDEEVEVRHRNFIFISPEAKIPPTGVSNCCIPEFLSPDYHSCRKAFEMLNTSMTPIIPKEGPLAIGIGTSIIDADGTLYRPIRLRVNGVEVTISKW